MAPPAVASLGAGGLDMATALFCAVLLAAALVHRLAAAAWRWSKGEYVRREDFCDGVAPGLSTAMRCSREGPGSVHCDGEECAEGRHGADRMVPVLAGSLYLLPTPRPPPRDDSSAIYLTLNRKLRYLPLCADFGPFNLGTTHHVCSMLARVFRDKSLHLPVIWVCNEDPTEVTNAVFLLGAYLCLLHGATPQEAMRPFRGLDPSSILPFRDATWVKPSFALSL